MDFIKSINRVHGCLQRGESCLETTHVSGASGGKDLCGFNHRGRSLLYDLNKNAVYVPDLVVEKKGSVPYVTGGGGRINGGEQVLCLAYIRKSNVGARDRIRRI